MVVRQSHSFCRGVVGDFGRIERLSAGFQTKLADNFQLIFSRFADGFSRIKRILLKFECSGILGEF